MNREEYMKCLRHRLRRLPKEDFNKAIAYFEEYFEDAGPEAEQQAVADLGSPEAAADSIIRDLAVRNSTEPEQQNIKKGFSNIWVGILAVCALPIGLPLALCAGALLFAAIMVVLSLLFGLFVTAFALAATSIPCVVVGVVFLFTSPANGLATIGMGLIGGAVGLWLLKGSEELSRNFLNRMTRLFGRIAKGGK
ncbi:MAG: DUF1700 domain-containing protein [Coprococcus sp.]|nr:DUF1700 domain-containing protein [Coprococcus sp.]